MKGGRIASSIVGVLSLCAAAASYGLPHAAWNPGEPRGRSAHRVQPRMRWDRTPARERLRNGPPSVIRPPLEMGLVDGGR